MARTLLGTPTQQSVVPALSARSNARTATLSTQEIDARLRQRRSASYIDAITKLDAGGHVHDRQALEALLAAIQQELPEIAIEHQPLGIVARCYLGAPYEVHTLDCSGQIVRHYKGTESLPPLLERARALALHPGYAFIEVYSTKLIAVGVAGDTSLVQG
ncbi:hypothetical protein [Noviherbaspirillum pedocola]|uniref:Uncharacterized protein n=1 Tax=Noviherbaspirillum pedocola TaxID=2801341 RepID=A0A934SU30_9BURK|nr:hypothetical protein [Noviherbaspirillum pedocola]MBK4735243.1 hypothetical protein [Noviherbaspirillum pedocola]